MAMYHSKAILILLILFPSDSDVIEDLPPRDVTKRDMAGEKTASPALPPRSSSMGNEPNAQGIGDCKTPFTNKF